MGIIKHNVDGTEKSFVEVNRVCVEGDFVKVINGHKTTPYTPIENDKIVKIVTDVPRNKDDIIKKHFVTSDRKVLYCDQYIVLEEIDDSDICTKDDIKFLLEECKERQLKLRNLEKYFYDKGSEESSRELAIRRQEMERFEDLINMVLR